MESMPGWYMGVPMLWCTRSWHLPHRGGPCSKSVSLGRWHDKSLNEAGTHTHSFRVQLPLRGWEEARHIDAMPAQFFSVRDAERLPHKVVLDTGSWDFAQKPEVPLGRLPVEVKETGLIRRCRL